MKHKIRCMLLILLTGTPLILHSHSASASPILEQISPSTISYTYETDYNIASNSSYADVTSDVTAVDLFLGLGNTSTSGCDTTDFSSFTSGHIALIQRGACTFQTKAENAATAGALGVLMFNQGDDSNRLGLEDIFLPPSYSGGIPVLFLTYGLGEELAGIEGLIVRMKVPEPTVPEPATLLLFGIGLAGLGFARKKKKSA